MGRFTLRLGLSLRASFGDGRLSSLTPPVPMLNCPLTGSGDVCVPVCASDLELESLSYEQKYCLRLVYLYENTFFIILSCVDRDVREFRN